MKELRIFDKVASGNNIVSLAKLIKCLSCLNNRLLEGQWEVSKGSYGYGEKICQFEDELNLGKQCMVEGKDIFPIIEEDKQYFFNATLRKKDADFEIGIFDSTFLFLRSTDEKLLNQIGNYFQKTQLVE